MGLPLGGSTALLLNPQEPRVGLSDPHGSLPTWDILSFCDVIMNLWEISPLTVVSGVLRSTWLTWSRHNVF